MTPWRYEASDPHTRRSSPPAADVAKALTQEVGAATLPGAAPLRVALDVADGRNLILSLGAERLEIFGHADPRRRRDEEHGGWIDDDAADLPLERGLEALVPVLVRLTGWRVDSDVLVYDPEGTCPRCGRSFYGWERECRDCGFRVDGAADPDVCSQRAEQLVARMIDADLLELEVRADRGALERRLADHIRRSGGGIHPERVFLLLEGAAEVAEVYGDDDDLRRLWGGL
jgi:hypothetical protein